METDSKQAWLLVLLVSPFLCFLLLGDEGAADCFSFLCASASLVSFMEFMVAAEKESCLSCWLSVVRLVARKLVVAFLKRVHILVSIEGTTPTKQTNKYK
jgi:hypothetical protein